MKERLKLLQKTLCLTQADFASRIGLKRPAITQLETGINSITEQTIKLICSVYSVNEKWLRTGEGEMFKTENDEYIHSLAEQYHLSELDTKIVKNFLNLDMQERKRFLETAHKLFSKNNE